MALAFWHIPQWRMFYLALTAFFGSIVLLGHYHYSIDVLAAMFITHGVFQMSCWLFGRDYALFRSSENHAVQRPKRAMRKRFEKWVEAHSRKRPTLVSVGGAGHATEPFMLRAVGEGSVPNGRKLAESSRARGIATTCPLQSGHLFALPNETPVCLLISVWMRASCRLRGAPS